MHNKTWIPLAAFATSIAFWFLFCLIIDALPNSNSQGSPYRVPASFTQDFGASLAWWSVAVIGTLIVVGANLATIALQRVFFPTDRNLWQEMERQGGGGGGACSSGGEEG